MAIQQFYTPSPPQKKTYTPKTNSWLRPCLIYAVLITWRRSADWWQNPSKILGVN